MKRILIWVGALMIFIGISLLYAANTVENGLAKDMCEVNYITYDACYKSAKDLGAKNKMACDDIAKMSYKNIKELTENAFIKNGYSKDNPKIGDIVNNKVGYCNDGCFDFINKKKKLEKNKMVNKCVKEMTSK